MINESPIAGILEKHGISPGEVVSVLRDGIIKPKFKITHQLVSSQLDADRLDYLIRDAYFTGVGFGNIDFERMANILTIHHHSGSPLDGYAVSISKGRYALESYLLTRHLMYEGVYYHKTTRGAELILRGAIRRAREAPANSVILPKELEFIREAGAPSWREIARLDDSVMMYVLQKWMKSKDKILSDLSRRFVNRDLFKSMDLSEGNLRAYYERIQKKIEKIASRKELPFEYYFPTDSPGDTGYRPYQIEEKDQQTPMTAIFVLDERGIPREISYLSRVVAAISGTEYTDRLYFPQTVRDEINALFK